MSAVPPPSSAAALGGQENADKSVARTPRSWKVASKEKKAEIVPKILDAYLGTEGVPGKTMKQISKDMGLTTRLLYRWMLTGLGDEKYQEKVTECLVARIADADDELEAAKDAIEVQKWREIARFRRMDFERRRPALYGPKAVVAGVGVLVIDGELQASMTELLDRIRPQEKLIVNVDADAV